MSVFPYFSNVDNAIINKLIARKGNIQKISSLNAWVRISSGVGDGLSVISNPNFSLLRAAGDGNTASIYGGSDISGVIGTDWNGKPKYGSEGQGYRPIPIIESIEIDEGAGSLSRKASFSITAFTREHIEELVKYFLEPGYTIFLEWGWNTPDAMGAWNASLTPEFVASFQSFKKTQERRALGNYDYDNYLGYITGGDLSRNGSRWQISVKCTGFTELPAYLVTNETGTTPDGAQVEVPFNTADISAAEDTPAKMRFMKMFNALPDSRRTSAVKALINSVKLTDLVNWDEDIAAEFNSKTSGFLGGLGSSLIPEWVSKYLSDSGNLDGDTIDFPLGTKLIPEHKFIRFGFLMDIINSISVRYRLGGLNGAPINLVIKTKEQPISAYKNIFSTDIERLFIPNPNSPKFTFGDVVSKGEKSQIKNTKVSINSVVDSSVNGEGSVIFPQSTSLNKTIFGGDMIEKLPYYWGYLDDLYVNFNFVKEILNTKNFVLKDALYQILNGISSAVNGLWDFQIVELPESDEDTTILTVVDLNFTPKTNETTLVLSTTGTESIFTDATFQMNMGGAMMNHIIGQRLGSGTNVAANTIPKTLFATEPDKILNNIESLDTVTGDSTDSTNIETDNGQQQSNAEKEKENLELFLGNLAILPMVEITDVDVVPKDGEIYDGCYLGAFKDSQLQTSLKTTRDAEDSDVSPLLPINFSFSIHGISGIKRGDKFKITGLPEKYREGFFQVLSVKHSIDDMVWKTEIEGGYRQT